MQKVIIFLLLFPTVIFTYGQMKDQNPKQAMEKLSFLAGKWSGDGWQIGQDRQKRSFTQTEDISFAADGEVLIINGLGKTQLRESEEEKVVHNAVAMITYNAEKNNYDFRSYVVDRGAGNYYGNLAEENHFEWFLDSPNGKIRYTIRLNEQGQWFEIGEFATGDSWYQLFEMTLDKVGE